MKHTDPEFVRRMLSDTGFYCRNVLGMNRDRMNESGKQTPEGTGGVRDYGPHQELVSKLDDDEVTLLLALMPRNSYKSSIVKGRIEREILSNPNCTILLCMHDFDKAKERTQLIRDSLRKNPIVLDLYGDIKGDLWRQDAFITSLRTNTSLLDPTFSCCSRDSLPTGGHYSLIIMDDIIDDQASKTPEGIENSKRALRYLMPLRTIGGKLVDIGTLYAEDDVHHFLLTQKQWHRVIHEVGFELTEQEDKTLTLTGENSSFPFLNKEFLLDQLSVMGPRVWLSQYKNRLVGVGNEIFRREHFQSCAWKQEFKNLTGYILTDTATSEKKEGCYNVIAYVGLDHNLVAYLLDLQVGHWPPHEFERRFWDMRARWSGKVNHQAELIEATALSLTYRASLERSAREKRIYLNLLMLPRATASDHGKDQRILRLHPRFESRQFFVVDTVPREFVDLGEKKVLWDPEGYEDPRTNTRYPGGELVRQFVGFRQWTSSVRDIPDALAQIDELDPKTNSRFCFYRRPQAGVLTGDTVRPKLPSFRPGRFHASAASVYRRRRR